MATVIDEFDTVYAPADTAIDDSGVEHDTIQSAIDNASSWVLVGPGTFSESPTISTQDLVLLGSGRSTVIDGGSSDALTVNSTGVRVQRLAADVSSAGGSGDSVVVSSDDVKLDDVTIVGGHNGILVNGAKFVRLAGVTVEDTDNDGIIVDNSPHINIDGAQLRSAISGDGLVFRDNNGTSTNPLIRGAQIQGISGTGVLDIPDDGVLSDFTIDGVGGDGFTTVGNKVFVHDGGVRNATGDGWTVKSGSDGVIIERVNRTSFVSNGTSLFLNGRPVGGTEPTLSLGGSDGSISPSFYNTSLYHIKVDAGGSNSNLQGIDGINVTNVEVIVELTGGENVTLEHKNSSASNPLWMQHDGQFTTTLTTPGDRVRFEYDGTRWREIHSNLVTA